MDVNNLDFWYILGHHWNWVWFIIIIALFGRGSNS